jgi:MYXO-CTERM domain-containing protein
VRSWFDSAVVVVAASVVLAAPAAFAQSSSPPGAQRTVSGEVVSSVGRWTADGSRVVTDSVIRTADGTTVTVSQLGGSADGFGMITIPGPPLLDVGMKATVTAHPASTARNRQVLVVDAVTVDALPPAGKQATRKFVRNGPTNGGGNFLAWASGCVQITYADEGTSHVAGDGEFTVLDATLAEWTGVECSYIALTPIGRVAGAEVGKDRVNLVKFRDQRWCRPAVDDDAERCHSRDAAAITTLAFVDDSDSDRDGEIVDADIEFNGVDFAISVDNESEGGGDCRADLANTMTHELGHVLGFDHTCRLRGQAATVDHNGQPVPTCDEALSAGDERIIESTMFAAQDCGEIKKATLGVDDQEAVCAVYPIAEDPQSCERPDELSAGCCSTGGGSAGSLALGALTLLGLVLRRRP